MFKVDKKFKNCVVTAKGLKISLSDASQDELELLFNLGHIGITWSGKGKKKPKPKDNAEGQPLPKAPKIEDVKEEEK